MSTPLTTHPTARYTCISTQQYGYFSAHAILAHIPLFSKLEETGKFISSLKAEEYEQHFELIKNYRDTVAVLNYAYEEGLAKGYAKGYAEGYARGYAKGKAKVVSNMLESGISIANIAACTELTEEELAQLINMNETQSLD